MTTQSKSVVPFLRVLVLVIASTLVSCTQEAIVYGSGNVCDMTPEGSVWLTVVRLSWAEKKFHEAYGRYGELIEMTDLQPGLPLEVTSSGRMGSYTLRIQLTGDGYVLRANPDLPLIRPNLSAFYADQSGLITLDRSGMPATPHSTKMD